MTLAGILTGVRVLVTKKNNRMAFLQLEDLHGTIEVIAFPNIYERYRETIREDAVVVVRGTVNCREEEAPKVIADWIRSLTGAGEPLIGRLLLLDARSMEWRSLRLRADPACPVCGKA